MRCGAPLGPGGACSRCVATDADTPASAALEIYRYLALGLAGVIAAAWLTPGRGSTLAELAIAGPWLTGPYTQLLCLAPCFLGLALHLVAARAASASGVPFPYADREIVMLSILPIVSFYGSVVLLDQTASWLGGASGASLVRRVRIAARGTIVLVVVAAAAQQPAIVAWSTHSSPFAGQYIGSATSLAWVAVVATRGWLLVMLSNAAAARLREARRANPLAALELPPSVALAVGATVEPARFAPPAVIPQPSGFPAEDVMPDEDLLLHGPATSPCPDCEPTIALVPYAGGQGLSCPRCSGRFLGGPAAGRAVESAGVRPEVWRAVVEQAHAGPTSRCPGCSGDVVSVRLRGQPVAACGACGGLWTSPSTPERGMAAREPVRASPETKQRPAQRRGLYGALGVLSLGAVAALWFGEPALHTRMTRPAVAPARALPAVSLQAGSADGVPPASDAGSRAPPPPVAPVTPPAATPAVLLGGRTPDQWRERLETLRRGGPRDEALYRLTRRRAEANGLAVEEGADGLRVQIGPALMAAIHDRRSR